MLIIGLTGGIGSGKTTVAKLFAEHGVPVIDTDEIARDLTAPGQSLLTELQNAFGKTVIDDNGHLNRATLAKQVFSDSDARHRLENILHPAIWHVVEQQIKTLNSPYCLLVVPLLLETQQTTRVDRVLVVDTTEELQISRTHQRDRRTTADIQAIMQSQVDRKTRLTAADDILDNTDNATQTLESQVESLHQKYLELARRDSVVTR